MNDLINSTVITMSTREIAELLGKRHDNIRTSAERMIKSGVLSTPVVQEFKHNGNTYIEFLLCKRDSLILVAQNCPEFTAKIVDRWQELENANKPKLPQSFAEALQLAADQAKALELAKPKIEFVDRFTSRNSLQNATQVAQTMKMSAVKMNRILDEIGGVYNQSVKRGRVFCQSWIDDGFGSMIQNEMGYPQAMFTASGVQKVTEIFITNSLI